MSLREYGTALDDDEVLRLVVHLSRYVACRASDSKLAQDLGWSTGRLRRSLSRLTPTKLLRVTSAPSRRSGRWVRDRTIYLVSPYSDERGALLVANFVRSRGREVVCKVDRFCGQLRCTPDQLDGWIRVAVEKGYLSTGRKNGSPSLVRTGHFPKVEVATAPQWTGPRPPRTPVVERLVEFIEKRGPYVVTSTSAIANHLWCSKSYARELVRNLIAERRLFKDDSDDGRHLSLMAFSHQTAHTGAGPTRWERRILAELASSGPSRAKDLRVALRWGFRRSALARLTKHGAVCTRLGGTAWWSIGPLPQEFRAALEGRVRVRKLERDRARRQRQRERLTPEHDRVLADLLIALPGALFEANRHRVPAAREYLFRQECESLATLVTRKDALEVMSSLTGTGTGSEATKCAIARALFERARACARAAGPDLGATPLPRHEDDGATRKIGSAARLACPQDVSSGPDVPRNVLPFA